MNGRVTTVHKRAESSLVGKRAALIPAPAMGAAQEDTPLRLPGALSDEDFSEFLSWQQDELRKFNFNGEILDYSSQRFDPVAEALAWRFVQNSPDQSPVIGMLLREFHRKRWEKLKLNPFDRKPLDPTTIRNGLLLAERLYEHRPTLENRIASTVISESLIGYSYQIKQADRHPLGEIKTEEQLNYLTAVSMFIVDLSDNGNIVTNRHFKNSQGREVYGSFIANRSLDAYLRANPHEAEKVISYVKDRGIGNSVKDTKQMISWLSEAEGSSVMDEGRL